MPRTNLKSPNLKYLILLLTLYIEFSTQLNCYDVDGSIWYNNVQCPGSQSCCADVGQCTQNRLCAKEGTLVRGPCLNAQFDDCSPLCHYTNNRNMLPRVHMCPDGTYCCDNSPDCCNNGTGVLLSPNGKLISNTLSLTITSSTGSDAGTTSTAAVSSSRKSAESTTVPTPSGTLDLNASTLPPAPPAASAVPAKKSTTNVKGIVIGVVVAVVVFAVLAGLFIWRQRRRIRNLEASVNGRQRPKDQKALFYACSELDTPGGSMQDGAKLGQQTHPAEMRGLGIYDRVVELPNSPRRSLPPPTSPS